MQMKPSPAWVSFMPAKAGIGRNCGARATRRSLKTTGAADDLAHNVRESVGHTAITDNERVFRWEA